MKTISGRQLKNSGLICYVKKSSINHVTNKYCTMKEDESKPFHVIILTFELKNIKVITGYRSPSTPMNEFRACLEQTNMGSMKDKKCSVMLGDFNMDTFNIDSNLESYLKKHDFTRGLVAGASITNNDTQIDTIFIRNIAFYHTGVYETYFSDHKPIFIGINDVKIEEMLDTSMVDNPISSSQHTKSHKFIPEKSEKLHIPNIKALPKKQPMQIDLDNYNEPLGTGVKLSAAQLTAKEKEQVLNEVLSVKQCLKTDTMELIGKIIAKRCPNYNFQSPFCVRRCSYKSVARDKNDIQFLFEEPDPISPSQLFDPNGVGHWICIYYCSIRNKVIVYDSYLRNKLTTKHKLCVKKLYPSINLESDILYEHLKNRQNDTTSCGVYAAAYAISTALRENVSKINFKLSRPENFIGHTHPGFQGFDESFEMRKHLAKIISDDEIQSFPKIYNAIHQHVRCINQIIAANALLTDDTMNLIGRIIAENCPDSHYNFQAPAAGIAKLYNMHSENRDDMQFLYEGPEVLDETGHWIFVYYVSKSKKLHVYNSLNVNFLSEKFKEDIQQIYPYINTDIKTSTDVIFERMVNQQNNGSACGVYASVYAISKALGKDPAKINFKQPISSSCDEVLFLRLHLAKIVSEGVVSLFPEAIRNKYHSGKI